MSQPAQSGDAGVAGLAILQSWVKSGLPAKWAKLSGGRPASRSAACGSFTESVLAGLD
jgi:hypothetical protein